MMPLIPEVSNYPSIIYLTNPLDKRWSGCRPLPQLHFLQISCQRLHYWGGFLCRPTDSWLLLPHPRMLPSQSRTIRLDVPTIHPPLSDPLRTSQAAPSPASRHRRQNLLSKQSPMHLSNPRCICKRKHPDQLGFPCIRAAPQTQSPTASQ